MFILNISSIGTEEYIWMALEARFNSYLSGSHIHDLKCWLFSIQNTYSMEVTKQYQAAYETRAEYELEGICVICVMNKVNP